MRKLSRLLRLAICYLSLSIFAYITATHIIHLISPDDFPFDPRLFEVNYLRFLLFVAFTLAWIGICIDTLQGRLKFISILRSPWKEKVSYLLCAILLSYFFVGTTSPPYFGWLLLRLTFLSILITLPTFVEFYVNAIAPSKPTITEASKRRININFQRFLKPIYALAIIAIVVTLVMIVNVAFNYLNGKFEEENQLRGTFYIQSIQPIKTTHAQSVTIRGYNFGWHNDSRWRLLSSDGEIGTEFWSDTLVRFVVPLHVTMGERQLWLQRPIDHENPSSKLITSNKVPLNMISRFIFLPDVGDSIATKIMKRIKRFIFENAGQVKYYIF